MEDFIKKLQNELEIDSITLELNTNLKECGEWDSMSEMILIAFAESNYSIVLNADDIAKITSVESFAKRIGII